MTDRLYRALIYKPGSTALSTGNVDFIVGVNALAQAPVVSGGRMRLAEGRVEAVPTQIVISDATSGGWTSHLGDAGGRNTGLNRFVQVQRADAGGAYAAIGGGRITDVTNTDNIAEWQVTLNPEWPTGANTMCFTTNTTHLYPPCADPGGKHTGFYGFPYRYGYVDIVRSKSSFGPIGAVQSKRFYLVRFRNDNPPMTAAGFQAIQQDVAVNSSTPHSIYSTNGAFKYLRFQVNGKDYVVSSLRWVPMVTTPTPSFWGFPDPAGPLPSDQQISDHQTKGASLGLIICAASSAFGSSVSYAYQGPNPFLHMMGAPASENTPLHIDAFSTGIAPGSVQVGGVHPMQVLQNLLSGAYSHSTVPYQLPLYSTSVFTGSGDLRKLPMPHVSFRITSPAPMQDWVQTNLCAPFGVMPTMDVTGAVKFRNFRLPGASTTSTGFSTGSLFKFTSTNLMEPHPDWRLNRNEAVTQVNVTVNSITQQEVNAVVGQPYHLNVGGDGLAAQTRTTTFYNDRYLQMGPYPIDLQYTGIVLAGGYQNTWVPVARFVAAKPVLTYLASEVFARFGDGPVQGTLHALSAASTVAPGDIVGVSLPTYPNYGTNARGGTRIVQVLSKAIRPDGYDFDYLDIGPAQAASSRPSFTLARSTLDPKNHLKATVGNIPSSGGCTIYLANSSGVSAPAVSSTLWHPIYSRKGGGTVELANLPSGQYWWGRAQTRQVGRGPSLFTNSSVRVQTSAISAPTGLKTSNIKARTANSTWAVGDASYPVQVYLDDSTASSPSSGNLYQKLPPQSAQVALAGLTANHIHKVTVRHYDAFGGVSASQSSAFTTLSTVSSPNIIKPPAMAGMFTIVGST